MKKSEFVKVMNLAIQEVDTELVNTGGYTCCAIDRAIEKYTDRRGIFAVKFSPLATHYANEVFQIGKHVSFTAKLREEDPSYDALGPIERLNTIKCLRVCALALFKEYMLSTKEYEQIHIRKGTI